MGSCGRAGEEWTGSPRQVPEMMYLLIIGFNNLVRKLRLRQIQGPTVELGFSTQACPAEA